MQVKVDEGFGHRADRGRGPLLVERPLYGRAQRARRAKLDQLRLGLPTGRRLERVARAWYLARPRGVNHGTDLAWARSSAGEHYVDIVGVGSSILPAPTIPGFSPPN